jgi:hypothetical protein
MKLTAAGAVRAGEVMTLILREPVSPGGKLKVRIAGAEVVAAASAPCEVTFKTPSQLKKGEYEGTLLLDGRSLAEVVLSVYPSTFPTVTKVYPQALKPGGLVTVTGAGLGGPKERVLLRVGPVTAETLQVDPEGNWFVAKFDRKSYDRICDQRDKNVEVTAWGVVATPPDDRPLSLNLPSSWHEVIEVALLALAAVVSVVGVVYLLFRVKLHNRLKAKKQADRMAKAAGIAPLPEDEEQAMGFLKTLVYEPENNTLSLSRAQLVWWLLLISYGYMFLFIAQHYVRGRWEILPMGNFAYTFLISLGTLITSQVATGVRGAKGAGSVRPGWGDLVTHGGVLALERVQQVFWTVIIGGAFIVTIIGTYSTATEVPPIPNELLVLMGLSSGAYVVGKSISKPGPIISQVLAEMGSLKLRIYGIHLSMGPTLVEGKPLMPTDPGVRILLDNVVQPVDRIRTVEPDPDHPGLFAKVLEVEISEQVAPDPKSWLELRHTLRVINADGQNADWEGLINLAKASVAAKAAPGGSGERTAQPGMVQDAAAAQQRQPTQDSESRIPAAPGDPGGGADAADAGVKEGDERET